MTNVQQMNMGVLCTLPDDVLRRLGNAVPRCNGTCTNCTMRLLGRPLRRNRRL